MSSGIVVVWEKFVGIMTIGTAELLRIMRENFAFDGL